MIGYLSEFWSAVTSATADTAEWFQSLGNAVAGALGNLLFYPLQVIVDFGLAIAYLFSRLFDIIAYLMAPFIYFFGFLIAAINALFTTITPPDSVIPVTTTTLFTTLGTIPLFPVFLGVVTAGLWGLVIFKTLHTLKH